MKTTHPILFPIFVLTAAILALGLMVFCAVDATRLPHQLSAILLGLGVLVAMQVFGADRLEKYGYLLALSVGGLCWLDPALFHPVQWLPAASVLAVASVHRYGFDTLTVIGVAGWSYIASTAGAADNLPAGWIACLVAGLLYRPAVQPKRHPRLKRIAVLLLCLLPIVLFLYASWRTLHWEAAAYLRSEIVNAAWMKRDTAVAPGLLLHACWTDMLDIATYNCGKVMLVAVGGLWTALACCLSVAARLRLPTSRQILVTGGAFILIANMTLSFAKLFLNLTFVRYVQPFLSPGGSFMAASFLALGLVVAGLTPDKSCGPRATVNRAIAAAAMIFVGAVGLLSLNPLGTHYEWTRYEPVQKDEPPKHQPRVLPESTEENPLPSPYKTHRHLPIDRVA